MVKIIPVYRQACIQIDITNACNLSCTQCTRHVDKVKKPFFMDVDTFEKALTSLEGYEGQIGIMGGEPTLHPEFELLCKVLCKYIPKKRRSLWTNGAKYQKHLKTIKKTFLRENVLYNPHKKEKDYHQIIDLESDKLVKDKFLLGLLIGNCWVNWRWSGSITPKGGFPCEVMGALDMVHNGEGGWPLEKGWWKAEPNQWYPLIDKWCKRCSAAIPMKKVRCDIKSSKVNVSRETIIEEIANGWKPYDHKKEIEHAPW